MSVTIDLRMTIDAPAAVVYELSLSVDHHLASMNRSGEVATGERRSGVLAAGDEVTWRGRHFGLPFTMTSRVTEAEPPSFFVDEQVEGPFKRFRHEHSFRPVGSGSTEMIDRITFDAPLGAIGDLVETALLRRYLTKIITERNHYLKDQAEATGHER